MEKSLTISYKLRCCFFGILILACIFLTSFYSYLLFHSVAELFSIVISCGIFMVAWNSRRITSNNYFLFLGIAYLFVALQDLTHTLSYKGMGVFGYYSANLPTQLWISARYVESISLCIAPFMIYRNMKTPVVLSVYSAVVFLMLMSIFYWDIFPICYVEGTGLTSFKKTSEYVISLIMALSVFVLIKNKNTFEPLVFRLIAASILVSIATELAFTFYVSVYGLSNLLGHLLKIISFYLIYKAIIQTGLMQPYHILFRDLKNSEEALRLSRNNYQNLVDTALAGIFKSKTNGELLYVNNTLSEMFEYSSPEEMLKAQGLSFYKNPEDRKFLISHLEKHGHINNFEIDMITRTGKTRSILVKAVLHNDTLTGTVLDITDRKNIEKTLQHALTEAKNREAEVTAMFKGARSILENRGFEKSARIIFDTCKTLIGATAGYVAVLSEDGTENEILFLDSGGLSCTVDPELPMPIRGMRAEAFSSNNTIYENDFMNSTWMKYIPDGHVQIENAMFAPLVLNKKSVALLGLANKPGRFTDRDARLAKAFSELAAVALQKSRTEEELNRHREHLMELVEERTVELQRTNEKLEKEIMDRRNIENELRLMALFAELNPFPVLRFDINSKVLMLNQAAITIFNLDTDREAYLKDLLPELENTALANCINNGSIFSHSAQINDRTFHFTLIGIPGLNAGQLYGSDITDQKKAEAESMRIRHLASIGEFTAGVAHEINNPINGIINYTQILANRLSPGSKEHDIAERIIREGDRIAEIIKSLLSFSSASNEKKRSVDVHEILTESLALTNTQLRKEHIRLNIDIPSDLPEIFAQPHQIEQVFMNLISNARYALNKKFPQNSDGKVLEIKARETAVDNFSSIEIIFEDRGTGIPEEIMDRIMNPFFTTKPAGIGTGLGMSISHGIINDHGGKLVVESVEGEFTKIIIRLPSANKGLENES